MEKFKQLNIPGLTYIILATAIGGSILSAVYLWLISVTWGVDDRLPVVMTTFFGIGLGALSGFMIKKFKIRSVKQAFFAVLAGCLCFTYFKWALYVSRDYDEFNAAEYFYYRYGSFVELIDGGDFTYEPQDEINKMMSMTAYDYYSEYEEFNETDYTAELLDYMKNVSYFEYWDYDYILGTNDPDTAVVNFRKMLELTAKEYYKEFFYNPSVTFFIVHPLFLANDIAWINETGRWTLSGDPVTGPMLWFVWLMEALFICVPAIVIAVGKAKYPFIEYENEWAELYKGYELLFDDSYEIGADAQSLKNEPELLFRLTPRSAPGGNIYYRIDIYHSNNYEENYLWIKKLSFVENRRILRRGKTPAQYGGLETPGNYSENVFIKDVLVSKDFLYRLFKFFNATLPFDASEFENPQGNTPQGFEVPQDLQYTTIPQDLDAVPPFTEPVNQFIDMNAAAVNKNDIPTGMEENYMGLGTSNENLEISDLTVESQFQSLDLSGGDMEEVGGLKKNSDDFNDLLM